MCRKLYTPVNHCPNYGSLVKVYSYTPQAGEIHYRQVWTVRVYELRQGLHMCGSGELLITLSKVMGEISTCKD